MRKAYFLMTKSPHIGSWFTSGPRFTRRGIVSYCTKKRNNKWFKLNEHQCKKMLAGETVMLKVKYRDKTYEVQHRIAEIEWRFVE